MLGACVEQLGDNWLVYASDYPHWDSDFPGTVAEVRSQTARAGLDDAVTAKLLGGNAALLYRLDL
jgi:predicted TIM-barrel fold metal-dependent hydrolase